MTKTLTVLSILVPITVPTYCAMLDWQTALYLQVSQVSESGPKPPRNFVRFLEAAVVRSCLIILFEEKNQL